MRVAPKYKPQITSCTITERVSTPPVEVTLVRCPNLCSEGRVKYYPDPDRALYDLVPCTDCKGMGMVTPEQAVRILKSIEGDAE